MSKDQDQLIRSLYDMMFGYGSMKFRCLLQRQKCSTAIKDLDATLKFIKLTYEFIAIEV